MEYVKSPAASSDSAPGCSAVGPRPMLILLLALGLSLLFTISSFQIQTDDSFIFLAYARNLALGQGFTFNPGDHVNGSTSALFPILISIVAKIITSFAADPFVASARILQTAALTAVCFFAARLLARMGAPLGGCLFPFLFFASDLVPLGVGMESFLVLALYLVTLDLYLEDRSTASSFFAGLLLLARPDSVLLLLPLLLHFVWTKRRPPPSPALLAFAATVVPWLIFSWWYFGSIVPETLAAKAAQSESGRWGRGLLFLKGFSLVLDTYSGLAPLLAAIALFSVLATCRKYSRLAGALLLISGSALYFLVYSYIINPPAYPWYYTPFALPLALLLSLALGLLLGRLSLVPQALCLAVATLCCALSSVQAIFVTADTAPTAKYEIYRTTAEWLNLNAPEGASVACNEVGILGYFYRKGKIIDPLGLITRGAAENVKRKRYSWYVTELKPDYLVFNNPPRAELEDFYKRPWFADLYGIEVILRTGRSSVRIYRRKPTV